MDCNRANLSGAPGPVVAGLLYFLPAGLAVSQTVSGQSGEVLGAGRREGPGALGGAESCSP